MEGLGQRLVSTRVPIHSGGTKGSQREPMPSAVHSGEDPSREQPAQEMVKRSKTQKAVCSIQRSSNSELQFPAPPAAGVRPGLPRGEGPELDLTDPKTREQTCTCRLSCSCPC